MYASRVLKLHSKLPTQYVDPATRLEVPDQPRPLDPKEVLMRHITAHRPSPAMVVAIIALLVGLGGGAYAQTLSSNSVGSKQLKNNAVTTKKIKNGAVNSNKVKNGSLLSADFAAGQIPAGPAGPRGATGERGPTGATGATGPIGPRGPAGATNVTVETDPLAPRINSVATCPAGRVATGGGGSVTDPTWYISASFPVAPAVPGGPPTQWSVEANDTGPPAGPAQPATAYVVCAAP
jgi:hypothetical protein